MTRGAHRLADGQYLALPPFCVVEVEGDRTILDTPNAGPTTRVQHAHRRLLERHTVEPVVERQEEDGMLEICVIVLDTHATAI